MLVSLALVGILVIGATLAWFTDSADITNTFTMGDVRIDLWETCPETGDRTDDGIEFDDVVPNETVDKDPTVTLQPGSQDAYIRMMFDIISDDIPVEYIDELRASLTAQILAYDAGARWYLGDSGWFYFQTILTEGELATLFETVTIPSTWSSAAAGGSFNIVIYAQAVQAAYFDDALVMNNETIVGWDLDPSDVRFE